MALTLHRTDFIALLARSVEWSLLRGGPTLEPKETEAAPLFRLARNRSRTMRDLRPNEKKKRKKKGQRLAGFTAVGEGEKEIEFWRERASSKNREGGEKNGIFHIVISIRDWRIVYGPILMKFQYVVPDDEGCTLTGVDRWTSSPVARLFTPTW